MIIYPVPVKGAMNLGVHSTLTLDGRIKYGPTVFPAFSPTNYDYLENVTPYDVAKTLHTFSYVLRSPTDRKLVGQYLTTELHKSLSISSLLKEGSRVQSYDKDLTWKFYRAGIRPFLFDTENLKLVTDWKIETKPGQVHVLNTVSPGWTSAMPFTRWIVDENILTLEQFR